MELSIETLRSNMDNWSGYPIAEKLNILEELIQSFSKGYERLVTPYVMAEAWMEPGTTLEDISDARTEQDRNEQQPGSVAVVLGGGNVSGISVNDSLHKLFIENQVVLLKINPVNEYLGPLINHSFRRLVDYGFFRVVYGSAAEGSYLFQHPRPWKSYELDYQAEQLVSYLYDNAGYSCSRGRVILQQAN
jgi:hypothetical protein